jgi:hypothetical protein
MKKLTLIAMVIFGSLSARAQSATEYIELVCAPQDYLAIIYNTEPIEGVLQVKGEQVAFWHGIEQKAEETIVAVQKSGADAVAANADLDAKAQAVFKACGAYGKINPDVVKYAALSKQICVDEKGQPWNFFQFGDICARWYQAFSTPE